MCITCGCETKEQEHGHQHRHDDGTVHSHVHSHEHGHEHEHGDTAVSRARMTVETDILARNDRLAAANRAIFAQHGIFVLNLVSSPGSGKTTLLERTLKDLSGRFRCAVIEGDQQTDNDAVRIAATGVPVRQINTGTGCHLDAHMVRHALDHFDLHQLDILLIENVGNLVCPASFDLGEHHKTVVLSVTEGEDKPLKYPQMFHAADVMLLNKVDLLPHVEFSVDRCLEMARRVRPDATIFQVSARSGAGMDAWYAWLAAGVAEVRNAVKKG